MIPCFFYQRLCCSELYPFIIYMELICLNSSKRIKLKESTEFIIGRRDDRVKNKTTSREQISLKANFKKGEITIKNLGKNQIRVKDFVLNSKEIYTDKINCCDFELPGDNKYKIESVSSSSINGMFTLKSEDFKVMAKLVREIDNVDFQSHTWQDLDGGKLIVYTNENIQVRSRQTCKIAAFDMDGTLIRTKSGKVFPVNETDWLFYCDKVVGKLQRYHQDGYKIVIFSNQGGISFGSTNKKAIKTKIENIVTNLQVPIQVYLASGYCFYRKPCPGMWLSYVSINKIDVDYDESFYVGDAAGRSESWLQGKKKDHSNADRLFSRNIRLKFLTPEEFFLGRKPMPFKEPDFDPNKIEFKKHGDYNLSPTKFEVIIMVGSPGSGKSHFIHNFLLTNGFASISRDVLGTMQNCIKATEKYLVLKKSIVIDNTNPNIQTREKFISLAKKFNVPIRCFIMESSKDLCKHNNKFRQLTDASHALVSDVIINEYWKKYDQPTMEEGFDEIITVPFVPSFNSPKDQDLYEMYLN